MVTNIGSVDRTARAAVGVVLIALAAAGVLGPWAYVGVILLITAAVSFCPLYRLLGLSTRAK
jgi:phosphatidylglycerophosphate synthase